MILTMRPLMAAALLVDARVDINARDERGLTALDHAVRAGRPEVIHAFALVSRKIPDPTDAFSMATQ